MGGIWRHMPFLPYTAKRRQIAGGNCQTPSGRSCRIRSCRLYAGKNLCAWQNPFHIEDRYNGADILADVLVLLPVFISKIAHAVLRISQTNVDPFQPAVKGLQKQPHVIRHLSIFFAAHNSCVFYTTSGGGPMLLVRHSRSGRCLQ